MSNVRYLPLTSEEESNVRKRTCSLTIVLELSHSEQETSQCSPLSSESSSSRVFVKLVSQSSTDTASASTSSFHSIFSYSYLDLPMKIKCLKQPLSGQFRGGKTLQKQITNLLSHFR